MKKFILISSLLAAGTLAANAATTLQVVESTLFPNTAGTSTAATYVSDIFNTNTIWYNSDGLFNSSGDPTNMYPVRNYLINSTRTSAGGWYYSTYSGTISAQISNSDNCPHYQTTTSGTTLTNIWATGKGDTVVAGYGTISVATLNSIDNLALTYSSTVAADSPIYLAVFYVTGTSGDVYRVANTTISGTNENVVLALDTTNIPLGSATSDGYFAVAIKSNSETWKASTLTGLNFVTVIPEPSLFGLFAGTLALGLAGTRRRRNRAGTQNNNSNPRSRGNSILTGTQNPLSSKQIQLKIS